MKETLIALTVICAAFAVTGLRIYARGANEDKLPAVLLWLGGLTATLVIGTYVLEGVQAAFYAWMIVPPYGVLVLWALEPQAPARGVSRSSSREEWPSDEVTTVAAPDDDTLAWLQDEVPTTKRGP